MKKILLVADVKGWIFERHCRELQKRITEYKIDIAYHNNDICGLSNNYDLVYVLDPMPLNYPPQNKTIMGLRCEFLFREHPMGAKGLYENGFPGRCVSIRDKCCIFHVVNKNMINEFKDVVTDKPLLLAQHGIDEAVFDRQKISIPKNNEKMVISCAGRGSNNKGFDIIQNVCADLGINYITAQYRGKMLRKDEMPLFYHKADVHVCMSKTEGLNNVVMEAGAMGLPVISTKCGAVTEIIKDGESGLLIDRNKDSLKDAIIKLKDKNVRQYMGNNLYKEIMTNWTWKVRIEDFRKMFQLYFKDFSK